MVFRIRFEPPDPEDDWELLTGDLNGRDVVIVVSAVVRMAMARGWGLRLVQVKEIGD